jgi:glycosyltransferase involved in cell wall biosynthesis
MIITDSLASKEDVIRHLNIRESRRENVKKVYCGVSERFRPSEQKNKNENEQRTILYVGRTDPYKNLNTLVRAFAEAKDACPFPIALTIAGSCDIRYPEPSSLAKELGVENAVRWTGYLTDEDLIRAYQSADILVHPSRYEGFGLQVVEAMACGVPVVCSRAGSLPEIAGDAAILIDPDDTQAFAANIQKVLTDKELASELSLKGKQRAADFTWSRTAGDILAIYRETMNSEKCWTKKNPEHHALV